MSDSTDSNPVFTYRAGFRRVAGLVQRWAVLVGFACLLVGGATWMFAAEDSHTRCAGTWQSLIGAALIVAGILWGFWWRGHLRTEFRREFGGN